MSTTDDGTTDGPTDVPTLTGERICPTCEGFGAWHGDTDDGELIVECSSCGRHWSAPDRRGD